MNCRSNFVNCYFDFLLLSSAFAMKRPANSKEAEL
jgi:hypothetical protein